jgi:hypothetical protein
MQSESGACLLGLEVATKRECVEVEKRGDLLLLHIIDETRSKYPLLLYKELIWSSFRCRDLLGNAAAWAFSPTLGNVPAGACFSMLGNGKGRGSLLTMITLHS